METAREDRLSARVGEPHHLYAGYPAGDLLRQFGPSTTIDVERKRVEVEPRCELPPGMTRTADSNAEGRP